MVSWGMLNMIGAKKEASGNFEKRDRSIVNKDPDPYNY